MSRPKRSQRRSNDDWARGLAGGVRIRLYRRSFDLFNFDRNDIANIATTVLVTRHHQTKAPLGWCLVVPSVREKCRFAAKIGGNLAGRNHREEARRLADWLTSCAAISCACSSAPPFAR